MPEDNLPSVLAHITLQCVHDGTRHFTYPTWDVVNSPNECRNASGAFGCALALHVSGLACPCCPNFVSALALPINAHGALYIQRFVPPHGIRNEVERRESQCNELELGDG